MGERITNEEDILDLVDGVEYTGDSNFLSPEDFDTPDKDELDKREALMDTVFDKKVGAEGRLEALKVLKKEYNLISIYKQEEVKIVLDEAIEEEEKQEGEKNAE